MPGVVTHILIARGLYRELPEGELKSIIGENYHAYMWGAQGPDLLMHGGFLPWHFPSNLSRIGGRVHKEGIDKTFDAMLRYTIKKKDDDDFGALLAYCAGFITHHSVDRTFHPFVYDAIPRIKRAERMKSDTGAHFKIESNLDVAMLRRVYNINPFEFRAYNVLLPLEYVVEPISRMLPYVMGKRFGRRISEREIKNAFLDMHFVQRFFFDPTGIKCRFVKNVEKLTGDQAISNIFHTAHVDTRFDYVNASRRRWKNPYDKSFSSDEDAYQLAERARGDAEKKIMALWERVQKGEKSFDGLFDNISFNTGLPGI